MCINWFQSSIALYSLISLCHTCFKQLGSSNNVIQLSFKSYQCLSAWSTSRAQCHCHPRSANSVPLLSKEPLAMLRERWKQNKRYLDHRTMATCKSPRGLMNSANKLKGRMSKVDNPSQLRSDLRLPFLKISLSLVKNSVFSGLFFYF